MNMELQNSHQWIVRTFLILMFPYQNIFISSQSFDQIYIYPLVSVFLFK